MATHTYKGIDGTRDLEISEFQGIIHIDHECCGPVWTELMPDDAERLANDLLNLVKKARDR